MYRCVSRDLHQRHKKVVIVHSKDTAKKAVVPHHVAIIMDGNGRWAKKRGLPRIFGHRAGVKTVKRIVEAADDLGIKVLTLYAFSTENWSRPEKEIKGLMFLLEHFLKNELKSLLEKNVKLSVIGDISELPKNAREVLKDSIDSTKDSTGILLNLAINYGGRQDIVRAVNAAVKSGIRHFREEDITDNLYTAGINDPDLLIRTSGEMRVSNFLLWQIAYSEIYVTPVLWPDFKPENLKEALKEYQYRDRRFGGV